MDSCGVVRRCYSGTDYGPARLVPWRRSGLHEGRCQVDYPDPLSEELGQPVTPVVHVCVQLPQPGWRQAVVPSFL
jgi:hypothetical protein